MPWALLKIGTSAEDGNYMLASDRKSYLGLNEQSHSNDLYLAEEATPSALGLIYTGPWGVKIEALRDIISIVPGRSAIGSGPPIQEYRLEPRQDEKSEVILLRDGDTIHLPKLNIRLVLKWNDPEVQVNSSVTPVREDDEVKAENHTVNPEDAEETEDDKQDVDKTVTSIFSGQLKPRSTPQLSAQQSLVVQETPTINRMNMDTFDTVANTPSRRITANGDEAFSTALSNQGENGAANEIAEGVASSPDDGKSTPSSTASGAVSEPDHSESEISKQSTTLRTPALQRRRDPTVRIPARSAKKRATPVEDKEEAAELSAPSTIRPSKRKKTEDASQDSALSTIAVDIKPKATPTPASARKKRASDPNETASTKTQKGSQKGSQHSASDDDLYTGSKPRVAFSNSSIQPGSQFLKFLKKQGGAHVDSIKDDCNILCVKDGTLSKTLKLLQSIALGIPIVTDKWLMDSAKHNRLLSLAPYKPAVPKQEKEWNFSIENVWGIPQSSLFQGYTVHFTPALKATYQNFGEIEEVCKSVGARRVTSKKAGGKEVDSDTIILAKEEGDEDAVKLVEDGQTCFSKDLLTNSILRGSVDLESGEFRIEHTATTTGAQPKKKGRSRRS